MELRKLKALVAALKAAGVTRYTQGDLTLQFGDGTPIPGLAVQVPDDVDLELPAGIVDPRAKLREIYAKPKRVA